MRREDFDLLSPEIHSSIFQSALSHLFPIRDQKRDTQKKKNSKMLLKLDWKTWKRNSNFSILIGSQEQDWRGRSEKGNLA